jgi:hypothetical protein
MTPHYPEATAVERTQARVERSYLREDGTPKLCMGKDSEADERSLLELPQRGHYLDVEQRCAGHAGL